MQLYSYVDGKEIFHGLLDTQSVDSIQIPHTNNRLFCDDGGSGCITRAEVQNIGASSSYYDIFLAPECTYGLIRMGIRLSLIAFKGKYNCLFCKDGDLRCITYAAVQT